MDTHINIVKKFFDGDALKLINDVTVEFYREFPNKYYMYFTKNNV
jgi:hypothetical protein